MAAGGAAAAAAALYPDPGGAPAQPLEVGRASRVVTPRPTRRPGRPRQYSVMTARLRPRPGVRPIIWSTGSMASTTDRLANLALVCPAQPPFPRGPGLAGLGLPRARGQQGHDPASSRRTGAGPGGARGRAWPPGPGAGPAGAAEQYAACRARRRGRTPSLHAKRGIRARRQPQPRRPPWPSFSKPRRGHRPRRRAAPRPGPALTRPDHPEDGEGGRTPPTPTPCWSRAMVNGADPQRRGGQRDRDGTGRPQRRRTPSPARSEDLTVLTLPSGPRSDGEPDGSPLERVEHLSEVCCSATLLGVLGAQVDELERRYPFRRCGRFRCRRSDRQVPSPPGHW